MKHRLVNNGFGANEPVKLNNQGKIREDFMTATWNLYFSKYNTVDFQINKDSIMVGVEPTYMHDPLKIICVHKNKEESYLQTGRSWGVYGSQIASTKRVYKDYKYDSKFIQFIDIWHQVLFSQK